MNYSNQEYDGATPLKVGDRYYAFDQIRDWWHSVDLTGRAVSDLFGGKVDFVVNGGVVTQGTVADRVDITAVVACCAFEVTVPNSDDLPPTVTGKTILARVSMEAEENYILSAATLNGSTVNYLKIAYAESAVFSRGRIAAAGSYVYEVAPSYTLSCNATPATTGEAVIAEIVGNGTDPLVISKNRPARDVVSVPVGTVWMFDGAGWVDDMSIPGFYACIPENAGVGAPDMVNKFAMGKVIAGAAGTGGANSYNLAVGQLPSHGHSIVHSHTGSSGGFTVAEHADHNHVVDGGAHTHLTVVNINSSGTLSAANAMARSASLGGNATYDLRSNGSANPNISITNSVAHTHTVGNVSDSGARTHTSHSHTVTVNDSGTTQSGNTGSGDAIENRPAYYSMIYIRKCA